MDVKNNSNLINQLIELNEGSNVTFIINNESLKDSPNSPKAKAVGDYYSWKAVGSSKVGEETKGGWVHMYTGYPASKTGEKDSFTRSVSVKRELSGTIKVSYKALEGVVGYNVTASDSFSITKTSASLKKGQYIKAYYMKNFVKNKITQRQYITTNGLTSPTNNYAYAYSFKPLLPKVKLDYFTKSARTGEELLYKTEIFDSNQDLVEEIFYPEVENLINEATESIEE